MNSNISPKYYNKESIFETEKAKIFNQNWIFYGFKSEFQNHNDFVAKEIFGKPILVQNIQGVIKCFLNVCSHRFSTIQHLPSGNRPLLCPYHGWSYNAEGTPTGIPKKPLFKNYSEEELCSLKLKSYSIEFCGEMVFIHLSEKHESLNEYLGSYFEELKNISEALGERVDKNSMVITANWKIIVENTLEGYHLQLIHKETLAKLMPKTNMDNTVFDFEKQHSFVINQLNMPGSSKIAMALNIPFSKRTWKIENYIHYLIFPNILISSSYGTIFNISVINPLSADNTEFISHVYIAKPNKENANLEEYKKMVKDYNRQVFDEDKWICEQVHIGARYTEQLGQLSLEEIRVQKFQENYIKSLEA